MYNKIYEYLGEKILDNDQSKSEILKTTQKQQ